MGRDTAADVVVATPLYERFVPADKLDETLDGFDSFHPLGRVGTTCDLANTITFLLSPAAGLGDRGNLERRRWRHGRPQLTPRHVPVRRPAARRSGGTLRTAHEGT